MTDRAGHREPRLHIRPGMDVYSAYQNQYLGSVVRVWRGTDAALFAGTPSRDASKSLAAGNAPMVHEEGNVVGHAEHRGNRILGEDLGPFPTSTAGNTGPLNQSAEHEFATGRADPLANVRYFAVRPGRINLGLLTRPFYVPTSAIHSLSMERVVLDVQREQMPAAWRDKPGIVLK